MTYKTLAIFLIILLTGFAITGIAAAQGPNTISNPATVNNPAPQYFVDTGDLGDLVYWAITWLLYIAGGLAVAFLLVGGLQYVLSRGNEESMEKAKKTISAAIIGLIIILMAYAVVIIVESLVLDSPNESTSFQKSSNTENI